MQNVIRKFDGLLMGQQFDFLKCVDRDRQACDFEAEVVELYQEYAKLSKYEQEQVKKYVTNWVVSLTHDEMLEGARHENLVRSSQKKCRWWNKNK